MSAPEERRQRQVLALPASPLQLLDRTFAILALFDTDRPTWSLSEVARAVSLKTTTTHRILQVLHQHGYLGRDETTKRYQLGMAAFDLGARARRAIQGQDGATTSLRWLASATGESAFLLVPSEDRLHSLCVQRVEAKDPLRLNIDIGRRLPIHAGAGQKVLLAFMSPEDQDRILSKPLVRFSRRTITDPDQLREDLLTIASRGWALSFEESHEGTWGIAAALLQPTGTIAACVGAAGPLFRYSSSRNEMYIREVQRAAESIAEELGLRSVGKGGIARPQRGGSAHS